MKKKFLVTLLLAFAIILAAGCGSTDGGEEGEAKTATYTDDCGRTVEIPEHIGAVAPSGTIAEMIVMTVAPDKLTGLANEPSEAQGRFYPGDTESLPVFGQFYGMKANLNMEALLAASPDVIIDIGEMQSTQKEDMDQIQEQTGIPVIFLDGSLDNLSGCYHKLGKLLEEEEQADEIADYVDDTIAMADENSKKIKEKKSVYYGLGPDGLSCNARGSVQADVIECIGAENAIAVPDNEITGKNGGTILSLEKLYETEPDVLLFTEKNKVREIDQGDKEWAELKAVKGSTYYEIPEVPYCWLGGPPSINRVLGIWWLGNLCYPEIYDYDMAEKTKEVYDLLWGYELTDEEARDILSLSTLKE